MFYGEGKIETTMRGDEGHEISEEVSVSKAVCPVRSLVRVIYRCQEGWFDESPAENPNSLPSLVFNVRIRSHVSIV